MIVTGKTGTVRLTDVDLALLRSECYDRDGGRCVVCGRKLRWRRGAWDSMHMAHIVGRGAGGPDVLENVQTKCYDCHIVLEHNPKSVPKKGKVRG